MTKSFNKFKNAVLGPFLVHFPKFWVMIQFQENGWRERWMEGWKDARTDRPYFIGLFWLLLGAQRGMTLKISP